MKVKVLFALTLALVIAGCSSNGGDDGVSKDNKEQLTDASTIAKKADGDYDKLSDADKQVMLKMANGDEKQARSLCKLMAHPPNEGRAGGPPQRGGAH